MTSSINPTSVYPTYEQFVAALMQALDRFNRNGKDYLTYLGSPHGDDEVDIRTSLSLDIFEALGWKFGGAGGDITHDKPDVTGNRPDIIVNLPAANRAAFVIETKSTNETRIDDGDPSFGQLAGYIETNGITLGILTNHVRVNAWQFRPESHTPVCSFDLREIYEQYKTGGIASLTPG